jgi:hypothetical protein
MIHDLRAFALLKSLLLSIAFDTMAPISLRIVALHGKKWQVGKNHLYMQCHKHSTLHINSSAHVLFEVLGYILFALFHFFLLFCSFFPRC